ncbi:hypothetical protein [Paracoccus sp. 22332]|uniref:hypothetical protein n=1 Tax=Paracoccus sp. 22332 TaxID=3453913 RepID=UPI003F849996
MRTFSPATAAYLASRAGFIGHVLVWISARDRSSHAIETIGFWTGADHQEFTIDGQVRLYYAAGSLLKVDPIRRQTGVKVRTHRITFSQVAPEVEMLIRGYDPRHAPVEVHRALFHPDTETLIDEPHVILRGFVDRAPLTTPAKGEAGQVALEIASEARALTRPLSRFRSDAGLRSRDDEDAFRQYSSLAGTVEVPWGR